MTAVVPQEVHIFLLILKTIFRSNLSFMKLGQWSKYWQVVSISNLQLEIGLSESKKLFLNLWSQTWLKPRSNLVRCLSPLKQLYLILGEGLILPHIFKKMFKQSEFRLERLDCSAEGKKEFLKTQKSKLGILLDDGRLVWRVKLKLLKLV